MKNIKKVILLSLAALILALFLSLIIYYYRVNSPAEKVGKDVSFVIEEGESVNEISQNLKEKKIIRSSFWFETYVWLRELESDFQAGEYILNTSIPPKEIVIILTSGQVVGQEKTIILIEGWNNRQMGDYFEKEGMLSRKDWLGVVGVSRGLLRDESIQYKINDYWSNFDFIKEIENRESLIGYLFPDTYRIYKDSGPQVIASKMLENFDNKVTDEMREDIKKQGKTLGEIIVMASVIQKEVSGKEDMDIVSGIFWKKIENGEALRSCATVGYALGENKYRYSIEDTKIDSPYNTYQNAGLPPGPICNPGLQAIKAAIYPEFSDYNYFLSRSDDGETVFSKTFREHEINQQKYLK